MAFRGLILLALCVGLTGCATNAVTGRSQYVIVSEQSAIAQSAQAYSAMVSQLDKSGKLKNDPALQERVDEITGRLVAQAIRYRPETRDWAWSVKIIDDPETVNAFCMAGGKMAIYTGLIEKIQPTDAELAQVMGHEIGHAIANHSAEKMSVAMTAQLGVAIFAALGSTSRNRDLRYGGGAIAAAAIVTLPNSRSAESEADRIGIELAARAGYDPDAAGSLWKKMASNSGAKSRADFLSTHPSPLNRIDALQALAPAMRKFYHSPEPRPRFDLATHQTVTGTDAPGLRGDALVSDASPLMLHTPEFERFSNGSVVLECEGACALPFALRHGAWKKLFDQGAWRQLVQQVVSAGYKFDVTYYYLGRAAEALGFALPARTYYERAVEATRTESTRCKGRFQDWCDSIDLPRLANDRLAADPQTREANVRQ